MSNIDLTVTNCAFPRLKFNAMLGIPFISGGDYRSLVVDYTLYDLFEIPVSISYFDESLHSLVWSVGSFYGSTISSFSSDLRSLCSAQGMFKGCSNLTSFNSKLFMLGNVEKFADGIYEFYLNMIGYTGEGEPPTKEEMMAEMGNFAFAEEMFIGCKLDAPSVENILTTIPAYDDGIYRELGMTIQSGEAAAKFGEITGIIPASTEEVEVPFKGWNVKVNLFSV